MAIMGSSSSLGAFCCGLVLLVSLLLMDKGVEAARNLLGGMDCHNSHRHAHRHARHHTRHARHHTSSGKGTNAPSTSIGNDTNSWSSINAPSPSPSPSPSPGNDATAPSPSPENNTNAPSFSPENSTTAPSPTPENSTNAPSPTPESNANAGNSSNAPNTIAGSSTNAGNGPTVAPNYIDWDAMTVHPIGSASGESFGDGSYNETGIIVVDANGQGHSKTVQGAVDMVPSQNTQRVKILIMPGIYRERVIVQKSKPYISFIGLENRTSDTVITHHNKASDRDAAGHEIGTYQSASVAIESDYFCATRVTFENTVVARPGGYGMQAVALRIAGDKAMFYRVRVLGAQDTLLDETGTHYFYESFIEGTVDFIFGQARSLYQGCLIHSTAKSYGAIAAHHRNAPDEDTGFSFVHCKINGTGNNLLGRAWGNYSRTIYAYSYIDGIIDRDGWSDWGIPSRQKTVEFGAYRCTGDGANSSTWVPWSNSLTFDETRPLINMSYIEAHKWLRL